MKGRHHRPAPRNHGRAAIVTSLLTAGITLTIALPGTARTATTASATSTTATAQMPDPPSWFWQTLSTYTPAARLAPATSGLPPIILAAERASVRSGKPLNVFIDAAAMPAVVLAAYHHAASVLAATDSSCHLPWQLLAAIGRVESDNGRDFAPGGGITADGTIEPPIFGPALDGSGGNAAIPNEYPALDGAGTWERAVGPMQFLPSTWQNDGADGNGDGRRDPNNVYDAALAAARYLCAAGGDLTKPGRLAAAVYSYNHSNVYVRDVLALVAAYEHTSVADLVTSTTRPQKPATSKDHVTRAPLLAPAPSPTRAPSGRSPTPTPTATSATPSQPSAVPTPASETSSTTPAPTATPTP